VDVHKRTIREIFDCTQKLEAPLFQRPYVWTEERNWEPLLEGILIITESKLSSTFNRPHFLGTIVLDQLETPTGNVVRRQIIDGQQRLVTLQLALAAARDISALNGQANYEKAFRKLTDNDMPLSDCKDDLFKVWPTNADQVDFRDVMCANCRDTAQKLPHSSHEDQWLIPDAYLYFYDKFFEWLRGPQIDDFNKRLSALYQTFFDGLQAVVIDLEQGDDPQEIFETLNHLGTPLLPADLVKNLLFRTAILQKYDAQKLHDQYWSVFDEERGYWRKEVRQGRLHRPRIDLFLYHYLTLKTREIILETQLYNCFKQFLRTQNGGDSAKHMELFRSYADIYRKFYEYPKNSREGLFFYRLEQMDISTLLPLMLEVVRRHNLSESRKGFLQIICDLESFLVRRMVCELTSKNYNRFFTEMIANISDKDIPMASAIREFLLSQRAETSRWPSDDEFRTAWMELPFYNRLKQSKTRLVLEAIERELYTEKTEIIEIQRSLTVEHVLPRGWEEHWPLLYDESKPEDKVRAEQLRRQALHKIGNLTLLTKKLNPAVSNGGWERKRKEILKHSALSLNRYFNSADTWDEQEIEKRTKELHEIAVKIWPHP